MDYEDQEFDYRKPMPKREKLNRMRKHRIQVLRNKKNNYESRT